MGKKKKNNKKNITFGFFVIVLIGISVYNIWIMYKNIEKKQVIDLKDLVEYQDGQVVSKTLVQNDYVSVTIFSFDKGEEISTHASGGDAMVTVLDGTGKFTIGGDVFILKTGDSIVMPKDVPHAVFGEERFKMELVVSF